MVKKLITLTLVFALLLTGFSLSPAQAGNDDSVKLQKILQLLNLPAERHGLQARLDRGQLVYGIPTDIPNNDWKPAPPDADGNDWQTANGIDLGHPGEEPRYLGKTADWNDFSNDWFPNDAPDQVIPAQRDMIEQPWYKGHCDDKNPDTISDYTWSVIAKTLQTYHERIGFPGIENSFVNNPAFKGNFNEAIKDYFKILAEPKPGLAGAVRHWHYRDGVPYYDTITVRWDIIPDFIVESIDPGVPQGQKAQPGQVYTGKVVMKAVTDSSFLFDPLESTTKQLFDAMSYKEELADDYRVPVGVTVNGQFVKLKGLSRISGSGDDIYIFDVKSGKKEDILEATFDWTATGGNDEITAGVNVTFDVLPWRFIEISEVKTVNNIKTIMIQGEQANLKVTDITLIPDPGEPGQLTSGTITVLNDSEESFKSVKVIWRVRHSDGSVLDENTIITDLAAGESKQLPFSFTPDIGDTYSVAAMINPMHDNPPNEVNWLSGDWPGESLNTYLSTTNRAGAGLSCFVGV